MGAPRVSRDEWQRRVLASLVEVGECLEWTGDTVGKTPVIYTPKGFLRDGLTGGWQSARMAYWVIQHGLHPGEKMVLTPSCRNAKCMAHLKVLPLGRQVKLAAQDGLHSTARQKAANLKSARARAKLSLAAAQEIRASTESGPALGKRYGVSREAINAVRRGQTWVDGLQGSSVFAWMPSA